MGKDRRKNSQRDKAGIRALPGNIRFGISTLVQKEGWGALFVCIFEMVFGAVSPFMVAALPGVVVSLLTAGVDAGNIFLIVFYTGLLQISDILYYGYLSGGRRVHLFLMRCSMDQEIYAKCLDVDVQFLESAAGQEEQTGGISGAGPGKGREHVPPGKGNAAAENLSGENPSEEQGEQPSEDKPLTVPFTFRPRVTEHTVGFPEEGRGVYSTSGILIDVEAEEIIAGREPFRRINPASMTKILTLLVAAEHVTDLQDTFTMTVEITDYSYIHDCSTAGFSVGDVVTVEELMYGTILPSGADAALALAEYVAGSQEAFVELMNQKLEQLGLSDSAHFTNCVGLYDENHYCTVYDMALILKAASDNELCRKVLSARKYTTSIATEQQPEGILLSNLFLRRIEDKDTHGEVLCAKTGFVNQSGSCAASLAADYQGREYLCVTVGSISSWACIYDHVEIYQAFLPGRQE